MDHNLEAVAASELYVVGIGASAGGLEAFRLLLGELPVNTGFAFVLIQHLDPRHESSLSEILGRAIAMPVSEVSDGIAVEGNHVYVIPPNTEMTIANRVLKLSPRRQTPGSALPIDYFFRSLAADCGDRSIGVVLSGGGSDGALGLQAIKEAGGVTFAQDPSTTAYPSMPQMAVAASDVDFVLTPGQIAVELAGIARNPHFAPDPVQPSAPQTAEAAALSSIFSVMLEATGIDFSLYREQTIQRRILRRLALRNIKSLEAYAAQLRQDPAERNSLQRDLLICVTSFFRDPESFEVLSRVVFPALVSDRDEGKVIRIWVPGCATGEEAYSIAIALLDYMKQKDVMFPVQIFASDVSEFAIDKARRGKYLENIISDVTPERLKRYFTECEDGYQVVNSVRDLCVFSRHNLIDDPPFAKLDLISCRNVLIYLGSVQKEIISVFHYALNDNGFLMLGSSEAATLDDMFSPLEHKKKIYARNGIGKRSRRVPIRRPREIAAAGKPPLRARDAALPDLAIGKTLDQLLISKKDPLAMLVDEGLELLEVRGDAAEFIRVPDGRVSFHLLNLMPDTGLFLEIDNLIHQAQDSGQAASRALVPYESSDGIREVNIQVTPLQDHRSRIFLILLEKHVDEKVAEPPAKPAAPVKAALADDRWIAKLKQDVAQARHRLLSIIEEHQRSEEDSQLSTEEVQSANEELQSLNEEMETAKEELQCTNEELITINAELESKNSALAESRKFAMSIVETVRVPLLVLDHEFRVKTANDSFFRTFQLPPGDVEGQPVSAIGAGSWDIPGFQDLLVRVRSVGKSFEQFEVEREFPGIGTRALVINGCRLDNLDLILVVIDDVTVRVKAEKALHESRESLRQAQKMEAVGRLAGGIAHDFNNLLTVILGNSHLAADSLSTDHEALAYVQEAESAAQRASALTDQLLAFSRRKLLQPKVFGLNETIADFERMLRRVVGDQIKIVVRPGSDLWRVRADPGEIGRVLMNLSLNARDAMPAGGKLTIHTANVVLNEAEAKLRNLPAGQYVQVGVRDTGIGLDEETRVKIFEPFFTTKDGGKGTGLGLSTVLGIVEQSGGAIWCQSGLGQGTRFHILLPAVTAEADQGQSLSADLGEEPKGAAGIVLLVEDEDMVRKLACTILKNCGYVVLEARDGADALAISQAHSGTIDLLLSDVTMPELGGRELAERLLVTRPEIKVLFMSGHTQDVILKEGVEAGSPFLQKPFLPKELVHKVREVLGSPLA
jgi:two-component system, chemotaxis family, CheB/CheR fusion protein